MVHPGRTHGIRRETYQRDALGNPTAIALPDGQTLSHLYYGSGHLLQTALDGMTVSEYERDSLHRQIKRTQGQLATFSGYNEDGLLSWQHSLARGSDLTPTGTPPPRQGCVTARDYYWNNHGEVGTVDDHLRGSLVYSYDRSGYLTGRSGQMYDHDHFTYDRAGNLLDHEQQGAVMSNRLPGRGRDRYDYNEWGELTGRRGQQLEWSAQGQLMRVISSNTETHYRYDALGRRVSKATYGRHTGHTEQSRTEFVWEGFRLLQEKVPQQGWRTYLYDAEQPYTPVACVTGQGTQRQVWYYHTDVTGTAQEVTSADGKRVWAGYLAAWGEKRADISNSGAYFHQPLRLPGQYFDDETGLHYNLFRYYAPESGRFISQDPIGLAGGINLYQYAPNPLSWIDPWGLSACAPTHHLATNKHSTWTERFRELFKKNDLGKFKNGKWRKDVLNDPLNRIDVPGHKGPHPENMHQEIYDRLSAASAKSKDAFTKELEKLRVEAVTPGSWLNDILTKV